MSPYLRTSLASLVLSVSLLVSCGASSGINVCDESISVSGYIVGLSQGLDGRPENQYGQFRLDTLDVYDVVSTVAQGSGDGPSESTDSRRSARRAAAMLADQLGSFIDEMDSVTWDLSQAATKSAVAEAWSALVTTESLARANTVEALLIEECGLPSRVTSSGDGPARLPDPSIPSPTATDPPQEQVDDRAENRALGAVVAALFSLKLDESRAECLGRELNGVVDMSSPESDLSGYQRQFQVAFDACGIDFTVPID